MRKNDRTSFIWYLPGLAVLIFFTALYLINWDVAISSDTALIGLMAKKIAFNGERPIFVWTVGYQGIFIEAYFTALLFKLFGVGPITANLAPTVVFGLALTVWTFIIERSFGRRVAQLSLLVTGFSCPLLYHLNLRTLPNFPEAFLIGALFLWAYQVLYERLAKGQWQGPKPILLVLILGFLTGFGFYTFALSVFFFAAAGLHLGLVYLRQLQWQHGRDFLQFAFFPNLQIKRPVILRWVLSFLTVAAWLTITIALGMAIFSVITGRQLDFIAILFPALVLLALLNILVLFIQASRKLRLFSFLYPLAVIAGYSPALYYTLILNGHTIKKLGVGGKWEAIARRTGYLWGAHKMIYGFGEAPVLAAFSLAILVIAAFFFFKYFSKAQMQFVGGQEEKQFSRQAPFFFLPLVMILVFVSSAVVRDSGSNRYLVFLVPCYALVISWFGLQCWQRYSSWPKRTLILAALALMFFKSALVFDNDIKKGKNAPYFTNLIQVLDENKITYGYAGYWNAYTINFMTNERLILEPLWDNYCPYYGPEVKAQKRIAWLADPILEPQPINGVVEVAGDRYRVEKRIPISSKNLLLVLQKLS